MGPVRELAAVAGVALAGAAFGQSATRAVFVGHFVPVNSVSALGATVASFRIGDDDSATLVGNSPSGEWTQAVALSPDGRWLASANGAANGASEELRVYRVEPDASLTPALRTAVPASPLDMVWLSDTLLAVTETKQGGSRLHVYRWDEGAQTLERTDAQPAGYLCTSLAFRPDHPYLYSQDSGVLSGTASIERWRVSPEGALTSLGRHPAGAPVVDLALGPGGSVLFAGTGRFGGRALLGFASGGEGSLAPLPESPLVMPEGYPGRAAVSDDGRFVFVAQSGSEHIRTVAVDSATLALADTGRAVVIGPNLSLGPIGVLGDLLVVLKHSNDPIGLIVMRINGDGSLLQIGPVVPTGNRNPEFAMAVWDPPPVAGCRADFDSSGEADVADIFAFLSAWFGGGALADFDGSGLPVNVADIFVFLGAWFAGC